MPVIKFDMKKWTSPVGVALLVQVLFSRPLSEEPEYILYSSGGGP